MALNDVTAPLPNGEVAVKTILAASVTTFDVTGPDSEGRRLVPCREMFIQPRAADIKYAEKAGEIEAGRYITIVGSIRIEAVRNGKFYMQAVQANSAVEILAR